MIGLRSMTCQSQEIYISLRRLENASSVEERATFLALKKKKKNTEDKDQKNDDEKDTTTFVNNEGAVEL